MDPYFLQVFFKQRMKTRLIPFLQAVVQKLLQSYPFQIFQTGTGKAVRLPYDLTAVHIQTALLIPLP